MIKNYKIVYVSHFRLDFINDPLNLSSGLLLPLIKFFLNLIKLLMKKPDILLVFNQP